MNIKNLLIIAFGLLFVTALTSCGRGDKKPGSQPSGVILPSLISYSKAVTAMPDVVLTNVTAKFEYDILNRISTIQTELFDDGVSRGFVSTLTFTYKDDNIKTVLTRTDVQGQLGPYSYFRNGSEIIANDIQNKPIEVDEGLRVLKYRSYNNNADYEFTYDDDGNATSISTSSVHRQITKTYTLTPGQSNGVFRNVETPGWYITSQMGNGTVHNVMFNFGELVYQHLTNSCIKSVEVDGNKVYEYNYTYNSDNYPTQIIRNPNFTGSEYVRYEIEYITVKRDNKNPPSVLKR